MTKSFKTDSTEKATLISIIIPVFNEVRTIDIILEKVKKAPLPVNIEREIIIVDDASTDGSRELLQTLEAPGLKVFFHTHNQGKGGAIRTGFKHIKGEYILIQDADLEYDPDEYGKLVDPLISDDTIDIVFGSRFLGYIENMKLPNYLANKILTFITNLLYGSNITDLCTGYKLYRTSTVKDITLERNNFDLEHELTAKLLLNHSKIKEIPINYIGRDVQSGKKVGIADFFTNLFTLLKYRFSI